MYDRRHKQYDCHPIFCNSKESTETRSFSMLEYWQKEILRKMALDYFY